MKILCPALILAGILAAARPSVAAPRSPHDCIEAALERSNLLSQNRHLIAADRADVIKKRGTTLPYVSGLLQGYELWGNPVSPYSIVGQVSPENGVLATGNGRRISIPKANFAPIGIEQIGITYPLFYQGSILGLNDPPAVASAVALMNQQELTGLISAQQIILNVLTEYIYAISYREQALIQQQIVDADLKQLEIIGEQVGLGMMLPYQAESARAQLAAAQHVLDSINTNLGAALAQLATLMGTKDESLELTEAQLPLIELPPLGPLLDQVMKVHPALRVQEANVEIARQQLLVDRDVRLPSVALNSSLSTGQNFDYFNGQSTHSRPVEFQSYLNVEIPVYDFGQRHAGNVESDERFEAARDGVRGLESSLRGTMKQAYNDILADGQTLADQQSAYVKEQQTLGLAQAQHAVHEIDELALISAEVATLGARLLLVSDQMAELLKYAELQNLSGGTWRWLQ